MTGQDVIVVDETIREGMQFRGLMFSAEQRRRILEFQEGLGVDISQVAYPPAHPSEAEHLRTLSRLVRENGYRIRVAGLCRANPGDVGEMIKAHLGDVHLHSGLNAEMLRRFGLKRIFSDIRGAIDLIRSTVPQASVLLALADVGATDPGILDECVDFSVNALQLDAVTLPDTSGRLGPQAYQGIIARVIENIQGCRTRISVHCHNDLGMASANTVMGVAAGAGVVEVTALGIGERNGIADLYTVSRVLKDQGLSLNVNTADTALFKAYYDYVNGICLQQTGFAPLNDMTPVFGDAVKTHVAGTHGLIHYSTADEKRYDLNVLCGRHMVEEFLQSNGIAYDPNTINHIVAGLKDQSVESNSRLTRAQVAAVAQRCRSGRPSQTSGAR